jgi:hypothetical protein
VLRTAVVRWAVPDGSSRSGTVSLARKQAAGDRIPVWTDGHGRLAAEPMDQATAWTNTVSAGLGTAAGVAVLARAARHLLAWRIMRRRMADWEREWARISQDWGRTGAGG